MKYQRLGLFLGLLVAACSGNAVAQDDSHGYKAGYWTGAIGLSYHLLNEESVAEQGLGDDGFSVDLYASYFIKENLAAVFGFGFMRLDDNAQFTQQVTSNLDSNPQSASSEVSAFPVFAELNYQTRTIGSSAFKFQLGAGYSDLLSVDRSITDCTNCREDNLDVEGGPYANASMMYEGASNRSNFGLRVRHYLSGDLSNSIMFVFEYVN